MIRRIVLYVILILCAFVMFFPVLYALSVSFMSTSDVNNAKLIPSSFHFDAYKEAIERVPLLHFLLNSFMISVATMVGELIISSLTAYALVFIPFKGRKVLFFVILSTMLIPWESTIIPNYLTMLHLGWLDTYQALIIPFVVTPFGIFLFRQHFLTLPKEFWESAQMDGCSRFRFYLSFVMPLSKTILSALGIFGFISTWNQYLWPLLMTNDDSIRTVQIGLKMMISQQSSTEWPMIMAASIIVLMPTLLVLFVGIRYIRKGLIAGAIKG